MPFAVAASESAMAVEQPQDRLNLGSGTLPIRGGKREKRQCVNAEAGRGFDDSPGCFGTGAMTGGSRQTSRGGPTPIAVRNDGYVEPRSRGNGRLDRGNLPYSQRMMHEHILSPPRRKLRKLLCNAKWQDKKFCRSAFARRADQRFHMIQVALQCPTPRCRQAIFRLRQAPVERFRAHDVIGLF